MLKLQILIFFLAIGCTKKSSDDTSIKTESASEEVSSLATGTLPKNLKWLTNDKDPLFADPDAKKGGEYQDFLMSFPLTLRVVGPDSNHGYRGHILDNFMSLVGIHPNTENVIPEIATHWAYGEDKKTMYYKINPAARWSDGKPITADDFLFTLEFYRSKHIIAPWYNNHYTETVENVIKYDDHTISVSLTRPKPDLHLYANIAPFPKHYYGKIDDDFTKKYNWEIVPNSGPYIIQNIKKGKSYEIVRHKDWWAKDMHYYKNRFNVDTFKYKVIRSIDNAYVYFLKGQLDTFGIVYPQYWHEKTKGGDFAKGYINKLWFYNDAPRGAYGFYLNLAHPHLRDQNVRLGIAHALNVDKVSKTLLRGDYERQSQHYDGYGKYTNTKITARPFDLDKANEYFNKAGWTTRGPDGIRVKDGKKLSFEITYGAKHITERLAIIKEEAKRAGLELKLKILDSGAAFKNGLEKKHEISLTAWSTSLRPDYWQHYHSENANKTQTNNWSNVADKELDALIMKERESIDEKERIPLSHEIQQKLHDLSVFIPTWSIPYFREAYWRWWRLPKIPATRLSGTAFSPFDMSTGGLFWFDQDRYDETKAAMKSGKTFPETVDIVTTFRVKAGN